MSDQIAYQKKQGKCGETNRETLHCLKLIISSTDILHGDPLLNLVFIERENGL